MYRWALVLPLVFLGGVPAADKDQPDQKKEDNKAKGGPLIDTAAFLREYDRDKDGYLSKDELPDYLHYNFERLDANKDGKISKEELDKGMAYLQQRRRPSDVVFVLIEMTDCDEGCIEEVQRAYAILYKLDKNRDGKLDAEELKAGREQILKDRVDGIIKRLDTDKDGKISREEARGMVKEYFKELDKNKDGYVDREELMAGAEAKIPEGKNEDRDKPSREK